MVTKKKFDVFLSHNSKDKPWVIDLKNALKSRGIKVWLDKDEIRPGDLFAQALEKGIKESKAVALVISPDAMNSGWVNAEYYRALNLATNKQLQLIPVLYKKAEIPGFLKDRNWVDFSNEAIYSASIENLIWGITGEKPKPDKTVQKSEKDSSEKEPNGSKDFSDIIDHIKNPFVRNMERRLRMGNAHWLQAGFSVPSDQFNFTSVYCHNQLEIFGKIEIAIQDISIEIAEHNNSLLSDIFLDKIDSNLDHIISRVGQVDDLLSSSGREFELSLVLSKTGESLLKEVERVRKQARYVSITLLSDSFEDNSPSDDLSLEFANLAISIEEYQRHLTAILNQAKLEKIYSQ